LTSNWSDAIRFAPQLTVRDDPLIADRLRPAVDTIDALFSRPWEEPAVVRPELTLAPLSAASPLGRR